MIAPLLVLLLFISACKKSDNATVPETIKPGYFSLTLLSDDMKMMHELKSNTYDFGDLKASKEFYFLLTNGGDQGIFDVQLSMDNNSFNISPGDIEFLPGGLFIYNEENIGLIPLLTLGITHGINLNGVGYDSMLSMGQHSSILTITGKTLEGEDTISIKSEFVFSAFARCMDIKLYSDSLLINLENPDAYVSSFQGWLRGYFVSRSSMISAVNTGNVSITIYQVVGLNQYNPITLEPNDSLYINTMPSVWENIKYAIDGDGTISDQSRIELVNNGKGYFILASHY